MKFLNILKKLKIPYTKGKNSLFINIICVFSGALIGYILSQFSYLNIDTKISVPTTLISICTAIIGLYIATSLKRSQSKSGNIHNYLQPKLDNSWKLFILFSNVLSLKNEIEVKDLSKLKKEIEQNIIPLKIMFSNFDLSNVELNAVESEIENLEDVLLKCPIKKNIIQYSGVSVQINILVISIHEKFTSALKRVNDIS